MVHEVLHLKVLHLEVLHLEVLHEVLHVFQVYKENFVKARLTRLKYILIYSTLPSS